MYNAQWILSFQNGDQQAFRDAYGDCFRPLTGYAWIMLRDRQESEQVVLESFVKLWDRRMAFESWPQIRSFLYTVTRNACLNLLESNNRSQQFIEEAGRYQDHEQSVEDRLVSAEIMLEIYSAIEELPGECKDIFKLNLLDELSYEEIAERKHIAVQTVRSQKAKALKFLRGRLLKKWLRDENAGN